MLRIKLIRFTCAGKELDYDQHDALLLSAATNYDTQCVPTSARSTKKVHYTELEDIDFELDLPSRVTEDFDYDIDASTTTLLSNVTNVINPNSDRYLHPEDYASLTPETKDLWKKLTPDMKAIILKGRNNINRSNNRSSSNKSNNFSYKTVKPPSCNGKPFTRANLHELLKELIVGSNKSEDNDVFT